jgi:hypothetical protein
MRRIGAGLLDLIMVAIPFLVKGGGSGAKSPARPDGSRSFSLAPAEFGRGLNTTGGD